jgi:hypothetical protein
LCTLAPCRPALAQDAAPQTGTDPFEDDQARDLVMGVVDGWASLDPDSYWIQMHSRARLGLLIPNQWNWRARTLYYRQLAEAYRFEPGSFALEETFGEERGAPLIGSQLLGADPLWGLFGFDPEEEVPPLLGLVGLSLGSVSAQVQLGSRGAEVQMLDSVFVQPMSALGLDHYRYRSGPPMPGAGPDEPPLLSVEFQSNDAEATPVVGLIWFDSETHRPLRAVFRPKERWPVSAGLRGWVRRIPLIPKNAYGEISFFVLDYDGSEESNPVEARMNGSLFWFWNQGIMPVEAEWALDWSHDDPSTMDTAPPPVLEAGSVTPLQLRDLDPFIQELDRVTGPPPFQTARQTATGAVGSVRFNQVQGINFRVRYPIPLSGSTTITTQLDIPTSSFQWTGRAGIQSNREPDIIGVEGYTRLADANWMEVVNGIGGTLNALLTGFDDGNYYLAAGGRLWGSTQARPWLGRVELFVEQQTEAPKRVDYSLFAPDTSEAGQPFSIEVDEGIYYGARANMNFQRGDDSQRGVLLVRLFGQAAVGEKSYSSIGTTTDLLGPLPGPFVGAIRANYALSAGNVPSQALYYLGGTKTIRGYPNGVVSGKSMYITTAELGTNIPLVRLIGFVDAGNADDCGRRREAVRLRTSVGGRWRPVHRRRDRALRPGQGPVGGGGLAVPHRQQRPLLDGPGPGPGETGQASPARPLPRPEAPPAGRRRPPADPAPLPCAPPARGPGEGGSPAIRTGDPASGRRCAGRRRRLPRPPANPADGNGRP